MRLRTFTAPNMAEAIQLIRTQLGDDAVILATEKAGRTGVRVTAGIEPAAPRLVEPMVDALAEIDEAFVFHHVPAALARTLRNIAAEIGEDDPAALLAAALGRHFGFASLAQSRPRRLLLAGPPGAGKTVSLAKLAARERLAGRPVFAVTCDTLRAGASEQLATYTRLLKIPAYRAKTPDALKDTVAKAEPGALVLIDTTGTNAWNDEEMTMLKKLAQAVEAEMALVLPAGLDPNEAADQAEAFARIGAARLITTRLDVARRLGGMLAAAEAGHLKLAEVGASPNIGTDLQPLDPAVLAGRLLSVVAPATDTRLREVLP